MDCYNYSMGRIVIEGDKSFLKESFLLCFLAEDFCIVTNSSCNN